MHDPRVGRFFATDPMADKYPWNSPYAFAENKVIQGIDQDGLFWNPVAGIGDGIARSMQSSINNIGNSISSAIDNTTTAISNTVSAGVNKAQLAIVNNKDILMAASKSMQDVGKAMSKVGLGAAAATSVACASGVGCVAPGAGLSFAAAGGIVDLAGKGLELAVKLATDDAKGTGDMLEKEMYVEGAGALLDVVIPGPNPKMSTVIKGVVEATKEVIKDTGKEVVGAVVDNKQKNVTDE